MKETENALSEANTRLRILQRVTADVHSSLDLEKVFRHITDGVVHSMGYTTAFFVTLDDEKKHFEIKAFSTQKRLLAHIDKMLGFPFKNFSFPVASALNVAIRSVMEGRVVVVKDLTDIGYPLISKKKLQALKKLGGTKSCIMMPLIYEEEVVGGVVITSPREEIPEEELRMIKSFVHAASSAIKNANLHIQVKQAYEELKSSEEQLKILFEFAPDGYYLNDLRGNIIDGNKAAEEITGYKREELVGESFLRLKLLSKEQIPKAAALLAKNVMGRPTGPDEFILNRKDGSQVPVEIRTYPVKIKGKTLVLGIARDITERKKADDQIKASLREKDVLLKEIHHRVKNNMQIISSLHSLQASHVKDEQAGEIFKSIQSRVKSMALIHEMLYQSKDFARIDFAGYVQSLTDRLFSTYGINSNTVKSYVNIKDVLLDIDTAIPCGLIINELVSNSLKYAFPDGKNGEIKIFMHALNRNEVELIVSDNGVGLPENLDIKKTESLGLNLVHILAEEQLKGKIKLDKTKGTSFRIKLSV